MAAGPLARIAGDAAVNEKAPIICCTAEILANLALREGPGTDVGSVIMGTNTIRNGKPIGRRLPE